MGTAQAQSGQRGGASSHLRGRSGAEQVSRGRALARAGVVPEAGENRRPVRDVRVRSRGHGGATTARSSDDSGPGLEPKTAATAGLPAARWGSAGLGDRREATDPRRGVPLLRGWTSVPGGGVPGIRGRPLPAPKQSQE